jgi:hypothetical protein
MIDKLNYEYVIALLLSLPPTTHGQRPPVDYGFRTIEASRSQSDTLHSVELLWTSDQPNAEFSS